MKRKIIFFMLSLLMIFSIVAPRGIAYAEVKPFIEESGQTETNENSTIASEDANQETDNLITENSNINSSESEPDSKKEFDENKPFTMAMLDEADDVESYKMDMEETGIPLNRFNIETITDGGEQGICKLQFPEGLTEIKPGELKNTVPALLSDTEHGNEHAYAYAHVGNTEVFYIGKLTVYNSDKKTTNYIVYTTDKHIDKRTVYVALKDNEQFNLVYKHGSYHTIDYQFQNMNGETISEGREDSPWTYDKIFGHDRVRSVASGKDFNGTVTIPRGYKATVLVKDKAGKDLHDPMELGKMMKYFWESDKKNQIQKDPGNKNALIFKESFNLEDVEKDIIVIVQFEKINSFTFNAKFWRPSDYANGRFMVRTGEDVNSPEQPANDDNCTVIFGDKNSFTWNFNGITSGKTTWEMDQLEINGEPITVPMVSLADTKPATTTTTLSTGTIITLTATSLGGNNGSTAKRAYTLKAENCFEDLTISSGNMVGHSHKEFATRALIGVKDTQYWHGANTDTAIGWFQLKSNTLLAKKEDTSWQGFDTFRMKLADGYKKLNVTFTDKESNVLQTNDDKLANGTKNNYIKYLIRTDNDNSPESDKTKIYGEYQEVTYDNWKPSSDGYYYCKADSSLRSYMNSNAKNGVVLLWFYADANMYGIDYKDGSGGDSAPIAENIKNMPLYQDGGEDGYNLIDNTKALISNHVPLDTSGKFIFDHWEILKANESGPTDEVKKDSDGNKYSLESGGNLPLSKEALNELSDCLYYNAEKERNTLTLRAVWRSAKGKEPIPYTVNYYITEIKNGNQVGDPTLLESHQHMANEGADLVTDLWQDENKTLSPIISEILKGDNDHKQDYTENGTVNYIVYEPLTNMKLENLSKDKHTVNIYLVKQPTLTVNKTVKGMYGDKTKAFKFTIELSQGEKPLNGSYDYVGSVISGINGITAPANGTLNFVNGEAEINLSHGQQITFTNLPFGSYYTVQENLEDGYSVSYNNDNSLTKVEGTLEFDANISVLNTNGYIPDMGITDNSNQFVILLGVGTTTLLLLIITAVLRSRRKV